MRAEEVTGVILAGGQSARMGRDKALLRIAGQPLVRHLAERMLLLGIRRLIVACGTEERGRAYGALLQGLPTAAEIVTAADKYPGCGPLAGLHAALGSMPEDKYAFVMACDMPMVSAPLFERLLQAAAAAVAPAADAGGCGLAEEAARASAPALDNGDADTLPKERAAAQAPSSPNAAAQADRAPSDSIPQVVLTPNQPFHALYHPSAVPELERRLERNDLRLMSLLRGLRTAEVALPGAEESAFINLNTPELYEQFVRSGE